MSCLCLLNFSTAHVEALYRVCLDATIQQIRPLKFPKDLPHKQEAGKVNFSKTTSYDIYQRLNFFNGFVF